MTKRPYRWPYLTWFTGREWRWYRSQDARGRVLSVNAGRLSLTIPLRTKGSS